jgi:hypothetical protein
VMALRSFVDSFLDAAAAAATSPGLGAAANSEVSFAMRAFRRACAV